MWQGSNPRYVYARANRGRAFTFDTHACAHLFSHFMLWRNRGKHPTNIHGMWRHPTFLTTHTMHMQFLVRRNRREHPTIIPGMTGGPTTLRHIKCIIRTITIGNMQTVEVSKLLRWCVLHVATFSFLGKVKPLGKPYCFPVFSSPSHFRCNHVLPMRTCCA